MGFVSKVLSDSDLCTKGNHVAQLVGGVGEKIFSQCYTVLVKDFQWARDLVSSAPADAVSRLLELGVALNSHHAAAYHRRVVTFLTRWPESM